MKSIFVDRTTDQRCKELRDRPSCGTVWAGALHVSTVKSTPGSSVGENVGLCFVSSVKSNTAFQPSRRDFVAGIGSRILLVWLLATATELRATTIHFSPAESLANLREKLADDAGITE